MSRVTCHVSHVTCNVSHVTCKKKINTNNKNCGASWRRVCFQRGLPRLVFTDLGLVIKKSENILKTNDN